MVKLCSVNSVMSDNQNGFVNNVVNLLPDGDSVERSNQILKRKVTICNQIIDNIKYVHHSDTRQVYMNWNIFTLNFLLIVIKNKTKHPNIPYTTRHQTGKSSGTCNATGSFNTNTCFNIIDILSRFSNY